MPIRKVCIVLLLILAGIQSLTFPAAAASQREDILVGRIAYVEGQLFRFIEEEKDWVLTGQDAPFGLEDALYSGETSKAEFILPNLTWVRIGENTQLQMIGLDGEATTVDVAAGSARLYNKSRDGVIKATTPFGYAVAEGDTVFDLYVGDESLEIIAVSGTVDFVHKASGARYVIKEGEASIIADAQGTAQGNGSVEADWDDWNSERDAIWEQRQRSQGTSADLLPEPIRDEAYTLEENGRWERVYYEGSYRDMWRPTVVASGWRPYTAGRWVVYYQDNCWIPDEPFGYVTHHYGSWVYVETGHAWYWMPPVVRRPPRSSAVYISFGWYPGRVGWFHSGESIGWVPLAPDEVYYGYRPWGHRTVVVDRSVNITVNIGKYRYLDEAVVVQRDHFYRGERYTPVVQAQFDRRMIAKSFKPAAVISAAVIPQLRVEPRRFAVRDEGLHRKPHASVVERIDVNQRLRRDAGRYNRKGIVQELQRAAGVAPGAIPQADIRTPTVSSKLVEAAQSASPLDPGSLRQRELKPRDRQRQVSPADRRIAPAQPGAREGRREAREERGGTAPDNRWVQPQSSVPVSPRDSGSAERQLRSPGEERGRQPQPSIEAQPQSVPAEEERRIRSPRDHQEERPASRQPEETVEPRQSGQPEQAQRPWESLGNGRIKKESEQQIRSPRERQMTPAEPAIIELGQPNRDRRQSDGERDQHRRENDAQAQIEAAQQQRQAELERQKQAQEQPRQPQWQRQPDAQDREVQNDQRRQQAEQTRRAQDDQHRQQEAIRAQQAEAAQQQRQAEIQQQKQAEMQQRQQAEEHQRRQQVEQARRAQDDQHRQQEAVRAQQAEAAQQQRQAEIQQQKQAEMQQRQQAEEHQRRQQAEQARRAQDEQRRQQEAIKAQQAEAAQQQRQAEIQRQRQAEIQQRQQAEEHQRRQQAEQARRAQDEQRRQQAEAAQQQRQAELQRQKQAEMQQRQHQNEQPQQPKKGKKKLTPEEEQMLEKQKHQQQ